MQKIIKDNYDSIVARGLIKKETNGFDFLEKLLEETQEVVDALKVIKDSVRARDKDFDHLTEELADVILVCLNFSKHFDFDIEKALKEKIIINFKRSEDDKN